MMLFIMTVVFIGICYYVYQEDKDDIFFVRNDWVIDFCNGKPIRKDIK